MQVIMLDFDLGQVGVFQDDGKLTHQLCVDCLLLVCHGCFPLFFLFREVFQRTKCEQVAVRTEAADHAFRRRGDHALVAEFLTGMNIRYM